VSYAGAEFWDQFFRQRRESGDDLDWAGLWTRPFLAPLREAGVRTVLELGCGTGNDAARLAGEGYSVTAVDVSGQAIGQARARFRSLARFLVADVTRRLPFADGSFDAVMSNVALHMFPDDVTRGVFAQVGRLVRPGGLFVFHVNSLQDRPLRARASLSRITWRRSRARPCTSSPRPTCASSWPDGSTCSWSRSRSRTARRASYSSTSGAA
jgi:SAM-dependent methyltransferase